MQIWTNIDARFPQIDSHNVSPNAVEMYDKS